MPISEAEDVPAPSMPERATGLRALARRTRPAPRAKTAAEIEAIRTREAAELTRRFAEKIRADNRWFEERTGVPASVEAAPKPPSAPGRFELDLAKATWTREVEPPERSRYEHMHSAHEAVFAAVGPQLVRNGWAAIPQDRKTRAPSKNEITVIRPSTLVNGLPTPSELREWTASFPASNAALVMGGKHNLWALDIDVDDVALASTIRRLALERLGNTPFVRFGRAPRAIMIYSAPPGAVIRRMSKRFAALDPQGEPIVGVTDPDAAIEVLGAGSVITAYGHHHKTGSYYTWPDEQPLTHGPDAAPVVTVESLVDFLDHLHYEVRPYASRKPVSPGAANGLADDIVWDLQGEVHVPRLPLDDDAWGLDGNGKITSGMDEFRFRLSGALTGSNPALCGEHRGKLAMLVVGERVMTERFATAPTQIQVDSLREKIWRDADNIVSGKRKPWHIIRRSDGSYARQKPLTLMATKPRDGSLDFLPRPSVAQEIHAWDQQRRSILQAGEPVLVPGAAAERSLDQDRAVIRETTNRQIGAALDSFFGDVAARKDRVHILRGSTGSGKTAKTLGEYLPAYIRAHPILEGHPVVYLAPTRANLAEAATIAKKAGVEFPVEELPSDEDLAAEAEEAAAGLRSQGIRAVVYQGKEHGCRRADQVRALNAAGANTAGLCHSKIKDQDGQEVETFCPFYDACSVDGYRRMKKELATAQVILAPSNLLTMAGLPKELKEPTALIVDESVVFQVLDVGFIPLASLRLTRREPYLTKAEKAEAFERHWSGTQRTMEDCHEIAKLELVSARQSVNEAIIEAATAGVHPVTAVGRMEGALDLVMAARKVIGRSLASGRVVSADMDDADIAGFTAWLKGEHAYAEARLLQIVQDRLDAEKTDRFQEGLTASAQAHDPSPPDHSRKARGDFDTRVQAIWTDVAGTPTHGIRISHRKAMNWAKLPVLLLDASADEDITRVLFGASEIVTHTVDAPQHIRTVAICDRAYGSGHFSPRMTGDPATDKLLRDRAAKAIVDEQKLISYLAAMFGHGRLLVRTNLSTRKALFDGWRGRPSNVDEAHFNAQRGLDVFKNHLAALTIGRSQLPVWLVDGYAAALTYDADVPELPFDLRGDGTTEDGKPLLRQQGVMTVMTRDGHDVPMVCHEMPTVFGRKVDSQWSVEEVSQSRGRLRSVYSEHPKIWIVQTRAIPSDTIVDAFIGLDEMLSHIPDAWCHLWRTGGILDPALMDKTGYVLAEDVEAMVAGMNDRQRWGFSRVSWVDEKGENRECLVGSWVERPESVAANALRLGPGERDCVEVIGLHRPLVPATRREPDKVMMEMMSVEALEACHSMAEMMGEAATPADRASFEAGQRAEWREMRVRQERLSPSTAGGTVEADPLALEWALIDHWRSARSRILPYTKP